jgi:hypothetical protein
MPDTTTTTLFNGNNCNEQISPKDITQVFKIGQFCPVKVFDDVNKKTTDVVIGKDKRLLENTPIIQVRMYSPTYGNVDRNEKVVKQFSFKDLLNNSQIEVLDHPAPMELKMQNVISILSSGKFTNKNGESYNLNLSKQEVFRIANGHPIVALAKNMEGVEKAVVLTPEESMLGKINAKYEMGIEGKLNNFLTFIQEPSSLGIGGQITNFGPPSIPNIKNILDGKIVKLTSTDGKKIHTIEINELLNKIPGDKIHEGENFALHERPNVTKPGGLEIIPTNNCPCATDTTIQPSGKPLTAKDFAEVQLAVYFEWEQHWMLKGFSRGKMLYSLPMAPQEETTIEVSTWDRRKKVLEQSSITETEQTIEDEEKTQDSNEVYKELTKKNEFDWKAGATLDVAYNGSPVSVKLGAHLNAAEKTNADSIVKSTTKNVTDKVKKAALKVKVQRSSKITETVDTGSEQKIIRKIKNPNLCRTLTFDFYEVISHYTIDTIFNKEAIRFCLMIENPISLGLQGFTADFIRYNEAALKDSILDRSLAAGFDAVRFLRAREKAETELRNKKNERNTSKASIPQPIPITAPTSPITEGGKAINNLLTQINSAYLNLFEEKTPATRFLQLFKDNIGNHKVPESTLVTAARRWLTSVLYKRYYPDLIDTLSNSWVSEIEKVGSKLDNAVSKAVSGIRPFGNLNMEPDDQKKKIWDSLGNDFSWQTLWQWDFMNSININEIDDAGLGGLLENFSQAYKDYLAGISTSKSTNEMSMVAKESQETQAQQNDTDRLEVDFPLRDYAIAVERSEALINHLNQHKDHYLFGVFSAKPPQEQLEVIDEILKSRIETGFEPGFFTPTIVSRYGKYLLVPVNHEKIGEKAVELLEKIKVSITLAEIDDPTKPLLHPAHTVQSDEIHLPSPGITIESRLGECDGCEDFIMQSRELDIAKRRLENEKIQLEVDRLRLRNTAAQLDDPTPQLPVIHLQLHNDQGITPA